MDVGSAGKQPPRVLRRAYMQENVEEGGDKTPLYCLTKIQKLWNQLQF